MLPLLCMCGLAEAFLGGIFEHMAQQQAHHAQQQAQQQQQQRAEVNNLVENTYRTFDCDRFLCEDTLACVDGPLDCPCVFPDSEVKCEHPHGYVCVSKSDDYDVCQYVADAFI